MDILDRFIVIDNSEIEVTSMTKLLRSAFPRATVLPTLELKRYRTFDDWDEVLVYLRGLPDIPTVVLFDLALGTTEDYDDVLRGMRKCEYIHTIFPDWRFLAYSRYSSRARSERTFDDTFCGYIDKGDLDAVQDSNEERVRFVEDAISRAIRRSLQSEDLIPKHINIVDSLGMRLVRAAFGDAVISEIVDRECKGWVKGAVVSLTSGFSGAFILSLTGCSDNGKESLILKVARSAATIEKEMQAVSGYFPRLGPIDGYLVLLDNIKHELPDKAGVYYRQVYIEGEPLLQRIHDAQWPAAISCLAPVIELCIKVARYGLEGAASIVANKAFVLTGLDVSRISTSLEDCEQVAHGLRRRDKWPPHLPTPDIAISSVLEASTKWFPTIFAEILDYLLVYNMET